MTEGFIKLVLFIFILLFIYTATTAQKIIICGFVKDIETGEPLLNVSVIDVVAMQGIITDNYGYFCLESFKDTTLILKYSYVGYESKEFIIKTKKDTFINIFLKSGVLLKEVKITRNLTNKTEGSIIEIPVSQIKQMPSLTGEPDLLKSFQLMPGIQMGNEGSSGLFVRGGSPDQNLYLIDDVPIYYINHLGGFISVFDASTIKKVSIYKAGFPPRYGGRLSSIVDIWMKDGNKMKSVKEVQIGTLSSKFFIEGPFKKEKSSYLLSLRRCNLDLLMRPFTFMNSSGKEINAYNFYDFTGKFVHHINPNNQLIFNFFTGRDKLLFINKSKSNAGINNELSNKDYIKWGNNYRLDGLYNI